MSLFLACSTAYPNLLPAHKHSSPTRRSAYLPYYSYAERFYVVPKSDHAWKISLALVEKNFVPGHVKPTIRLLKASIVMACLKRFFLYIQLFLGAPRCQPALGQSPVQLRLEDRGHAPDGPSRRLRVGLESGQDARDIPHGT